MLLQRTAVHHCSTPHHTTVHIPHTHFLQLPSGGGVEGVMGPRPLAVFGTDNSGSAYGCVRVDGIGEGKTGCDRFALHFTAFLVACGRQHKQETVGSQRQ